MTRAVGLLTAASAVTLMQGTPGALPAVALGSEVLFHLERAAALLAALMVILVMIIRAARGELPVELSTQGLRYASSDEQAEQALTFDVLQVRQAVARLEERLNGIEGTD